MSKPISKFVLAVGIVTLSTLASASCFAAEGWGAYAGAGIGAATDKNDSGTFNVTTFAFKIFGGYSFGHYFALEADYVNPGTWEQRTGFATSTVDSWGVNAFAVGKLPISERFLFFGKVGRAFYHVNSTYRAPGAASNSEDDQQRFAYGVGAGFDFNKHLRLLGEYEAVDIPFGKFNIVSLSGVYRF